MNNVSDLRHFCQYVVSKYGSPQESSEDEKADAFRTVYLHNQPPTLATLKEIALAIGIHVNGIDGNKLPPTIRGYHQVYEGKRDIYYKNGDTKSGIVNTILHEFREMVEPMFAEVSPSYKPLQTTAAHMVANKFATAVLLPVEEFRAKIYETGFDVIALSSLYSKSCSQVLLRMGEVLQGTVFMYAALYEREAEQGSLVLTYWTRSTNNEIPEANVYGADVLFPRKGKPVVEGSLVDRAVTAKKPFIASRITLLDGMEDDGLVGLAVPLVISNNASKVVLTLMLADNIRMLQPQIERINPVEVYGFHRHL